MAEETESGPLPNEESGESDAQEGDLPNYYEDGESMGPVEHGTSTQVTEYDGTETPPDDQEMPLTEHIEEMILRLAVVMAVAGVVTALVFPFADQPIQFIWDSVLPRGEQT
ncbi:MAG: hypothetical protein V5A37_07835, partial [Halobacteriales archaeon]